MESPVDSLHHHKKTLHSKPSFGKYPHPIDSPTYDASEEDNDPLIDDGGSPIALPVSLRANRSPNAPHTSKLPSRVRHQLTSGMPSDDGTDSQTYDGGVESSITAGAGRASSNSMLTSQIEDNAPSPSCNPAALTPEDIQAFVQKAINGEPGRPYRINPPPTDRPVRIYTGGVYDLFHFGHALQLRQAKLSFPNVYLLAGVGSDEDVSAYKAGCVMTNLERCEAVRHCRWVDEVIPNCPWVIDGAFLEKLKIDYVSHDEEPYATEGHDDIFAFVKERGQFIPTRRTPGVSTSDLLARIISGYRQRDFDKKLERMGRGELKAEGSNFEDRSKKLLA